ncbi:OLC1v1008657C1 [Oldenlandia corymbosa var. corymbosa]|uniref:OLC1v1008657C1 n=1 Tax=Oldenlandia corymbosa var. corymbosa TaxID=529605 RepID=A0AAV1DPY6_OLDCO|nr:OLC1v1008657C1 [Oldenlandia corymbosa var. corymbosa]
MISSLIWEYQARENQDKILNAESPVAIRVTRILRGILQATHRSLGLKNDFRVSVYVPRKELQMPKLTDDDDVIGDFFEFRKKVRNYYSSHPNKRVQNRPLEVRKFGIRYGTEHLEGLNWELMLIDDPVPNAAHLPYGRIMLYTKWLEILTDAELATVLAHEVGHGLARHPSENLLRLLLFVFFTCVLVPKVNGFGLKTAVFIGVVMVAKIIDLFITRRSEIEADQIGIMLLAGAGYDPRQAPKFPEKSEKSKGSLLSSHPSGKKRAKKLRRGKVTRKAEDIYDRARAGQPLEAFK